MIFLCFSSNDRYTVVKSCLYHLKNYGLSVWYDYHELILGAKKKEKNFVNAIENSNYFIIVYSQGFFHSPCAIQEENIIFDEFKKRPITIFPLLYNISFNELPQLQKSRIENLIYNEITDESGSLPTINQIVCKFYIDQLTESCYDLTPCINLSVAKKIDDIFIRRIIDVYSQISADNFNARIALLFSLFEYSMELHQEVNISENIIKTMNYLFNTTKMNIPLNHKELIIAELALLNTWGTMNLMLL